VNPKINNSDLKKMTKLFYKDYDIHKLMVFIFSSKWFYNTENMGSKIKSPIELIVGIQRVIPMTFLKPMQIIYMQKIMGQILLKPINVAGWKQDRFWIDSNTLIYRMKLASLLANNGLISIQLKGEFEDSYDEVYKKNIKNYYKVKADWDHFNVNYGMLDYEELKKLLIYTTIDKDTNRMLSKLKFSNKEFVIQLMSIPEYQLC
jgi:hypothetical protein